MIDSEDKTDHAVAETRSVSLRSRAFRIAREASWIELEALMGRETSDLSVDELMRLPVLYRSALSSLSVARSISLDKSLEEYLDNLCLRGFLTVYAPRATDRGVLRDLAGRISKAFVALRYHILVATAAVAVGMVSGFTMITRTPSAANIILNTETIPLHANSLANLFANALPVCLLAAGLGVFLGVPTLALLVWYGVVAGAMSAAQIELHVSAIDASVALGALAQVIGVTLSGAAGLRLAQAILLPGPYSRVTSASLATPHIADLLIAAVTALIVLTAAANLFA